MSDGANEQSPDGPVRVTIFGQAYNLRSPNSGEHVVTIAQLVDERMRQIASHLAVHDVAKVAVLAALNFADEWHRQKEQHEREKRSLLFGEEIDDAPAPPEQASATGAGIASWFEAVFEPEAFGESAGDRMSTQLVSKLQGRRPGRRERAVTTAERTPDDLADKE